MKTTKTKAIRIDAEVYMEVKKLAVAEDRKLRQVFQGLVVKGLPNYKKTKQRKRVGNDLS